MGKVKSAFHNTLRHLEAIRNNVDHGEVGLELALDMLSTINEMEYELAFYHSGFNKIEVDDLMQKTYKPRDFEKEING